MKNTDATPPIPLKSAEVSLDSSTSVGPVPAPSPRGGLSPARPSSSALCSVMTNLSRSATRTFLSLVDGLHIGSAKKIDNAPGAFMAVSVDYLDGDQVGSSLARGWSLYAVAHRYEANGDLVPDPDVEFYVVDDVREPGRKAVYPTAIDQGPMGYRRHLEFDEAGQPSRFHRRGQADLARFCNLWMRNIAAQQRLGGVGR
jgi:hypothetical protein